MCISEPSATSSFESRRTLVWGVEVEEKSIAPPESPVRDREVSKGVARAGE